MKNKLKKINALLPKGAMIAMIVTPFILMIDNVTNVQTRNSFYDGTGFNIETMQTPSNDNAILFGQFNNLINVANATEIQLVNPYGNTGLSSSDSKTLINNDRFAMNFYAESPGMDQSIVIKSLNSANTIPLSIPIGVGVGVGASQGVVSAQLIDNKLWLIIDTNTIVNAIPQYKLRLITLDNVETDNPTASNSSNHTMDISSIYTQPVGGEPKQSLVISPVYETIGNQTSIVKDEIIIYQQNATLMQGGTHTSANMTRFFTDEIGTFPRSEALNKIRLPNDPNARLLSAFIHKTPGLPTNLVYDIGIYHSSGIDANAQIAYTASITNKQNQTIYDESPIIIGNLNAVDSKNQMSHPKAILTKGNYELFWIYPTATNGSTGSKVFSTSLDNERNPNLENSQPQVLDLGIYGNEREIAQISYQDNGNFDAGTLYIPVKYKNPNLIESSLPGIINWRSTTDSTYWTQNNGEIISFNPIFEPFVLDANFPSFTTPNEAAHSAAIEEIDILNNEITYLFNYVNKNMQGKYFRQTRSLKQDNLLNLLYNSVTPQQIVTNVGQSGIEKYSHETNNSEILPRIKEVSKDYLSSSSIASFEIVGGLNFDENTGFLKPQVRNTNGVYVDGFLKTSPLIEITLIQQPEIGFIPLKIHINTQRNFNTSSAKFVDSVNNNTPGTIGDMPKNMIQITSAYLPTLRNISAIGNDFTGVVELSFEFVSSHHDTNNQNGTIQFINLTITGFSASQTVIAIVVPIILVVIGTTLGLIIFFWIRKKKKDMFVALQAGMSLKEKMSGDKEVDSRKATSTINVPLRKRVPQKIAPVMKTQKSSQSQMSPKNHPSKSPRIKNKL